MVNISAALTYASALQNASSRCTSLSSFHTSGLFSIEAQYLPAGSVVNITNLCGTVPTPVDLCRVGLIINTTSTSTTRLEAWLPDQWYGRVMSTGNGGLSGCIDFASLSYGVGMHFATLGTDGGHTGFSGKPFLNAPEVIKDLAWRSVHVEADVSKKLAAAYYGTNAAHSYYVGCSQGGRQGFTAAERFPEDFDGILAGSPVLNLNYLASWFGLTGKPFLAGSPGAMTDADWILVHNEVLEQCDELDGKKDGIVAYPDECHFQPEVLLCSKDQPSPSNCLNDAQVSGLRVLYSDMYDSHGKLIAPRYSPGAEHGGPNFNQSFNGQNISGITTDWFRYAIYNDPEWDPTTITVQDAENADKKNPADIRAWTGDLRNFRSRGGKMLTYQGAADGLLGTGLSTLQYLQTQLETAFSDIDSFYALYFVPGMDHCTFSGFGGLGAWKFGQFGSVSEPRSATNTSESNALLALVDWVEGGKVPGSITGLSLSNETQSICKYPSRGHWNDGKWTCSTRV